MTCLQGLCNFDKGTLWYVYRDCITLTKAHYATFTETVYLWQRPIMTYPQWTVISWSIMVCIKPLGLFRNTYIHKVGSIRSWGSPPHTPHRPSCHWRNISYSGSRHMKLHRKQPKETVTILSWKKIWQLPFLIDGPHNSCPNMAVLCNNMFHKWHYITVNKTSGSLRARVAKPFVR